MMGMQTAIGCLARIVGPICATLLYDLEQPVIHDGRPYWTGIFVFPPTAALLLCGAVLMAVFWRRLVPWTGTSGCPATPSEYADNRRIARE